ncbi:hypothetical protein ZWY2020_006944 [Hordeum vulgare]|nr:hypothetical protein ZWY2020_006944 [Hordeum vulgare]
MAAPPPVLTLAVEKGPREGETRRCRVGAALRVGRIASGNDLAVRDVGASQRHLTIEFLPPPASRWAVSDLGSSNGTFINGARLLPSVPAPLSHGDLIILGQSTVLAVSIAPDSDVKPGPRRSSRRAAAVAVAEEKPTPSVTRLSTRKMLGTRAAAAPSETEKGGPGTAAVVVEEESHLVVTRGGGRKKVAGAEPLGVGKEEMEEAAVATLRGKRKKVVEFPELEKADEQKEEKAAVATRGRKRKKAVESPELEKADGRKEEKAAVATRGRKRKNSVEFPELETADEQKEEKAVVATRGRKRKKKRKKAEPSEPEKGDEAVLVTCRDGREVATTVAPPPLPPKTRVQGRVTRARARKAVLEVEEEEEVAAPREKEKSDKVAAGDEEVEGTANALEEVPVAQRGLAGRAPEGMSSTECAASNNGGKEINEGGGKEENGKMEAVNSRGELEDDEKARSILGEAAWILLHCGSGSSGWKVTHCFIPPTYRGLYTNLATKLQSEGTTLKAMAVPQVDKKMLGELEVMGFPAVRSIRALHYSGNSNLQSAINWLLEHESDSDIDQLPLVSREISIECGDTLNEVRNSAQGMRTHVQERKSEEQATARNQKETSEVESEVNANEHEEEDRKRILALHKSKRDEEEKARGRIRNQLQEDKRERIQAAKDVMEAKQTLEENQRRRMMESRKAEQEEEKRARERIRQRIDDDKAERRRGLGLLRENTVASPPIVTLAKVKPIEPVVTSEQLRDCLRTLKKSHKDDNARVKRAFQILLKIVANIVKNPEEDKFRRIRLSNPVFKDRVGNLQGGVEFLELCGFQKLRNNSYLVMPRGKVDVALLNSAAVQVASAMENPYFGLLSK